MRLSTLPLLQIKGLSQVKLLPWVSLAGLMLLSWWLRVRYVWVQPLDYDEGHWLMFGALVNAGYPAYSVTFVGIPPLALWLIQLGIALFDITLAIRYPMMLLSLIGVAAIYCSFQPWKSAPNLLGGLLAASFLSFSPLYFQGSASIMAEVPAVALAVLSFVLAQQYCVDHRARWLFLSGLSFGLSLALKVFVIFIPLLVVILLLLERYTTSEWKFYQVFRQLLRNGGLWAAGVFLPLLIFLLLYDPEAMAQQVFAFRFQLRDVWAQRVTLAENVKAVGQMWLAIGVLGLAGTMLGLVTGWRQRKRETVLWLSWLVLSTVLLIWHIPLRARYGVMLVPGVAALSAIGIVPMTTWLASRPGLAGVGRIVAPLVFAGVLGWASLPAIQSAASPPSPDTFPDLNLEAVRYVWQNSLAGDCVVTDDQRFAFAAGRLVPPALSETSWARIITQRLTAEDIASQVLQHNCPMTIYADNRFDQQLPGLRAKMEELYLLELNFGQDVVVFTGNRQISRTPALPIEAELGETITLHGVDLDPSSPWRGGQEIRIAAYWTALQPPPQAYKIFWQLRNRQDETVASFDHFPFPPPDGNSYRLIPHLDQQIQSLPPEEVASYPAKGMWPTSAWPPGQVIREVTAFTLPPGLPPGPYELYGGMYEPATQTRLQVQSSAGTSDSVGVTSVEIVAD